MKVTYIGLAREYSTAHFETSDGTKVEIHNFIAEGTRALIEGEALKAARAKLSTVALETNLLEAPVPTVEVIDWPDDDAPF